jgi:type I restriction enzyme S subunit
MTPQELKNSILQLAIQGKLVEQRPEEISVDITKLKAKATDEYEFDLPEKWAISHVESISTPIPTKQYQVLESEVKKEGTFAVISQSKEYSIGFTDEKSKVFCHDIPVIVFGDHTTEVKFVTFDFVIGADGVKILLPQIDYIIPKFLYYVFQFNCIGLNKVGGYSRHYKYIKDKPVPLPPLAEQKRIVAKIEELLPLIERYEKAWSCLEDFNKRFPGDMQKSILQMAIQGKLVEQRPEEGTGEELYRQIQTEKQALIKAGKIKKDKPLPEITEDEIPFEIPESWKWVRLGNAISLLSGTDFKPEEYNDHAKGIPYITGASSLSETGVLVNRWTETPRVIAENGDVLLVCKGSGYGKTVICDIDQAHIARQIMAIKKLNSINMQYVMMFLKANLQQIKANGQGVIPGIDRGSVLSMCFPLPSLAEQKRIVARLEELLPLCERLK